MELTGSPRPSFLPFKCLEVLHRTTHGFRCQGEVETKRKRNKVPNSKALTFQWEERLHKEGEKY